MECPHCGAVIDKPDFVYCPNCGKQLMNRQDDEQDLTPAQSVAIWRWFYGKAIKNTFIVGIILAVVWEVLTWVVPQGWPMSVVNIFFFIISLWVFWWPLFGFLKATVPAWLAWVISIVCWALLFIVLRSLLTVVFHPGNTIPVEPPVPTIKRWGNFSVPYSPVHIAWTLYYYIVCGR